MANIVDWEYYNSLHDIVDEIGFERLEPIAENQIKTVIGAYRWNHIEPDAFYYDQLKQCVCMIINKLAMYEKGGVGTGLASVSNDGYTESYAIQTHPQMLNDLRSCIVQWLSGTGLVGAYKC